LYAFLTCTMRATCLALLILLDFIKHANGQTSLHYAHQNPTHHHWVARANKSRKTRHQNWRSYS
jgi:hypothetical protein